MCGLAGYIGKDIGGVSGEVGDCMRGNIVFRGRDAQGEWSDGERVQLFHSRLSIIDLEGGGQPMTDHGGRYVIIFNGEVYNYRELRRSLESQGAVFRTQSDTEVVLEGYKLRGRSVCRDLNGMFAFAIWDRQVKELFIARDHLGKKPLFWCAMNGLFYFASNLTAFRSIPGWTGALSRSSIAQYGILGAFSEGLTIFKHVHALPYASHATVRPGDTDLRPERYWRMDFSRKSRAGFSELLSEYEELLCDATKIRLRADVPLALTFSGGVDSGTLAAVCAQKLDTRLACYTVDYHTEEDPSEETINAERVARMLGLDWHYIHFDYNADILSELESSYSWYDQPCQQMALVYSLRLYQAIKPHATVVLSGNGADELFTGYIGDERLRRQDTLLRLIRPFRPLLRGTRVSPWLRKPLPEAFSETILNGWQLRDAKGGLLDEVARGAHTLAEEMRRCGVTSRMDFAMFNALTSGAVDSNYRLPDISGLAAQVEVRSPFLDYRMVQFAARLPHRFKVTRSFRKTRTKYLPRQYYLRYVPEDIAYSPKKGMGANLRWDLDIVRDRKFGKRFNEAFDALDDAGLRSQRFRSAFAGYAADVKAGRAVVSRHAGVMMNGFMLGAWLQMQGGTA